MLHYITEIHIPMFYWIFQTHVMRFKFEANKRTVTSNRGSEEKKPIHNKIVCTISMDAFRMSVMKNMPINLPGHVWQSGVFCTFGPLHAAPPFNGIGFEQLRTRFWPTGARPGHRHSVHWVHELHPPFTVERAKQLYLYDFPSWQILPPTNIYLQLIIFFLWK